jgi:hypothetical protein
MGWDEDVEFVSSAAPPGLCPYVVANPGLTPGANFGQSLRDSLIFGNDQIHADF